MRWGIMSDSHGDMAAIRRAVDAVDPVDQWLHAGDYSQDAYYLGRFARVPVITVAGNSDGRVEEKPDQFIDCAGKKVWLTHGHRYHVKSGLSEIKQWARRFEVDIVIYGHTHQARIDQDDRILLINPGCLAYPVGSGTLSVAVLEVDNEGNVKAFHVQVP